MSLILSKIYLHVLFYSALAIDASQDFNFAINGRRSSNYVPLTAPAPPLAPPPAAKKMDVPHKNTIIASSSVNSLSAMSSSSGRTSPPIVLTDGE